MDGCYVNDGSFIIALNDCPFLFRGGARSDTWRETQIRCLLADCHVALGACPAYVTCHLLTCLPWGLRFWLCGSERRGFGLTYFFCKDAIFSVCSEGLVLCV